MSTIEWTGKLDDDCTAHWNGMTAHCELLDSGRVTQEPELDRWKNLKKSDWYEIDLWWCQINRGKEVIFSTADFGGSITTGALARAVCEAIMRGAALRANGVEV